MSVKSLLKIIIFTCLFLLNSKFTLSQVDTRAIYLNIDSIKTYQNLNQYLWIFEDTNQNMKLKDVINSSNRFKSTIKPSLKLYKTYWAKLILHNQLPTDQEWVLYVGLGSDISVFTPNEQKGYDLQRAGRLVTYKDRSIKNAHEGAFKVKIRTLGKEKTIIYIRMYGEIFPPMFKLKLKPVKDFYQYSGFRNIIESIFQGALWVMLLYNLILFLQARDKTYMFYSLYILSYSVFYFTRLSFGYHPVIEIILATFSGLMTMVLYFQFMRRFLNFRVFLNKWNRILRVWIWVRLLGTLGIMSLFFVTLDYIKIQSYVFLFLMGDAIIFFINIFIILRSKNKLAIYIIIGSFFLASGTILSIFSWQFRLSLDGVIFTQVGVFLELVLFSVGLGYRERKNEQDKRLAQEENALILKEQNVTLEHKVKERTKQITEKNEELQMQKEEILTQRDSLQERGEELQFAYNQITDSVRYAQTIQNAILPFERKIQQVFEQYFIIYQPKDIVSGDFYWFNTIKDNTSTKTVAAVIDCTGHGVPGAFMSMIGNTLLNETINEKHIFDPAKIISLLHQKIRNDLRQAETNNSDGMDMVLCLIENLPGKQFKMTYSGAKRPLYYVHNGEFEQLKSDRFSIGGEVYEDERKRVFTNQEVLLNKGDVLYMMTDGFGDAPNQERRRFGSRNIKKMLATYAHLTMQEQKAAFEATLEKHQGNQEPRDDVTMLGFRL